MKNYGTSQEFTELLYVQGVLSRRRIRQLCLTKSLLQPGYTAGCGARTQIKGMHLCCSQQKAYWVRNILWNNQQMQLYAVNFIPLLVSLYMFRVFYTPIIRSTIFKTVSTATGTDHSIVSATYSQRGLQAYKCHRQSWQILIIKPSRCNNFSNLFWKETLHVSDSSSVHHQEFFTAHTATVHVIKFCWQLACRSKAPARKLSANFYDMYRCCVCSEKLLMMDRGTVRNM